MKFFRIRNSKNIIATLRVVTIEKSELLLVTIEKSELLFLLILYFHSFTFTGMLKWVTPFWTILKRKIRAPLALFISFIAASMLIVEKFF